MPEAIIPIVFAVAFGALALLQFMEKGPVLNNSYLYASKEDRAKMNKKPLYCQSAICFTLIAANFAFSAIAEISNKAWLSYIGFAFLGIAIVYAVISSIVQYKKYGIL